MAELFRRERSVITKHVRNVFRDRELDEKSNVQNLHIASSDKPVAYYNLDVIISVGYRVKSNLAWVKTRWSRGTTGGGAQPRTKRSNDSPDTQFTSQRLGDLGLGLNP